MMSMWLLYSLLPVLASGDSFFHDKHHAYDKSSNEFGYLLDRVRDAEFFDEPFLHLEINPFLNEQHLNDLMTDPDIHMPPFNSSRHLIKTLMTRGYEVQEFPGSITSIPTYLKELEENPDHSRQDSIDLNEMVGRGMTFRLKETRSDTYGLKTYSRLLAFMNSEEWRVALLSKFNITRDTTIFSSIQKYLKKYIISPHPDHKTKALTYVMNINRDEEAAARAEAGTNLFAIDPENQWVERVWKNCSFERAWIPWRWASLAKTINENNNMLVFSPHESSLHGIHLNYDHLRWQRTQLYGNAFYRHASGGVDVQWNTLLDMHDCCKDIRPEACPLAQRLLEGCTAFA